LSYRRNNKILIYKNSEAELF